MSRKTIEGAGINCLERETLAQAEKFEKNETYLRHNMYIRQVSKFTSQPKRYAFLIKYCK